MVSARSLIYPMSVRTCRTTPFSRRAMKSVPTIRSITSMRTLRLPPSSSRFGRVTALATSRLARATSGLGAVFLRATASSRLFLIPALAQRLLTTSSFFRQVFNSLGAGPSNTDRRTGSFHCLRRCRTSVRSLPHAHQQSLYACLPYDPSFSLTRWYG